MTSALRALRQAPVGTQSVFILAVMMILAPGLGVFGDEMLQDTFKSMVVALLTLLASLVWVWQNRREDHAALWHDLMWLPVALMVYALASMAWSHTYLAGAEAIRWFALGWLMWLCLNVLSAERLALLALGIHLGAVLAAFWATLQFWFNVNLFAQGPNPASTFVNRNFLAEFLVCALPFSIGLLLQARNSSTIRVMAASVGWMVLAILMTGTRSATVALLVLVLIYGPLWFRVRLNLGLPRWSRGQMAQAAAAFGLVVFGLGLVESGNPKINAEHGPQAPVNALERAIQRSSSVAKPQEYSQGSFSMRIQMWQSTARMVLAHPWAGVGAGAWEVEVPLFQSAGTELETDYYAHNELLQLLAEYGALGWCLAAALGFYLCLNLWRIFSASQANAPPPVNLMRLTSLASLTTLLFVSCAGFPLHLAATGAMFALGLGTLMAADVTQSGAGFKVRSIRIAGSLRLVLVALLTMALALAVAISTLAALCESKIVRAVSTAYRISSSGISPDHPAWASARADMLQLMREGIAINPHYRKITPLLADQLALWGDWKDALWIWESVVTSRPHVVGLYANIARGYLSLKQLAPAQAALDKAQLLQPRSPAVRAVEALILYRSGRLDLAQQRLTQLMADRVLDLDVLEAAYAVGLAQGDWAMSVHAMELRQQYWPELVVDSWLKIGAAYDAAGPTQARAAHLAYSQALQLSPPAILELVKKRIPPATLRALQNDQTSASKG